MAVETSPQSPVSPYAALFRGYIQRSLQATLQIVQQAGDVLPAEDGEQALHSLGYAFGLPEAWPTTSQLLAALAPKLEQAGYREEWLAWLERGLQECLRYEDSLTEAELRFNLGVLYQLQGKLDEAGNQFAASAAQAAALGRPLDQARALNRRGYVARLQSRLAEAQELAAAALALLPEQEVERGYSYFVQASVAFDQRAWPEAVRLYRLALGLWQASANQRMKAWSLTNLATALRAQGEHEEARRCLEQALDLFEQIGDPVHQATARMNLGNVHLSSGRTAEALEQYCLAEPVFRKVQDKLRLAHVYNNLGMAYRLLERWDESAAALLAAIDLWRQLGDAAQLINTMDGLGLTELGRGRPDEAAAVWRAALAELDRVPDETRRQHLHGMVDEHLQTLSS